jgi:hypothetical protein
MVCDTNHISIRISMGKHNFFWHFCFALSNIYYDKAEIYKKIKPIKKLAITVEIKIRLIVPSLFCDG